MNNNSTLSGPTFMLNATGLKKHATIFRQKAQKLGFDFSQCQILDIFSYAHYGRAYASAHQIADRQLLPPPDYPPPFLSLAADRYDIEEERILEVLEETQSHYAPPRMYASNVSAEQFKLTAKQFRVHAVHEGIKLKMTSMNDFFSRSYFDRAYTTTMAALSAGENMDLAWDPQYLTAACAFYRVDVDHAFHAFEMTAEDWSYP